MTGSQIWTVGRIVQLNKFTVTEILLSNQRLVRWCTATKKSHSYMTTFIGVSAWWRFKFCSTCPVEPICCIRHGRPWHSAAEVIDRLWHWRCCPQVVPVVPDHLYPVCPSWYGPVNHCLADMRCSTGLSASANVYSWPGFTHPAALPVAAPLRSWHSDLWCKWSIWCRRPAAEGYWISDSCCRLDVGQSAPTEFR